VNTLRRIRRDLGDDWSSERWNIRAARRANEIGLSLRRQEQTAAERFCNYVRLEPSLYRRFQEQTGFPPPQPITNDNRLMHQAGEDLMSPVRAMTFEEVRAFFGYFESVAKNASSIRERRTAARHQALFKTILAYGTRANEAANAKLSDCMRSTADPENTYGDFGSLSVDGKAKMFGPPRRRTIYTVGQFGWIASVLEHHRDVVMPLFTRNDGDYLFVTEDGHPLDPQNVSTTFRRACDTIGIQKKNGPTTHSLRRLYATTLAITGVDPFFISRQLGHTGWSTTQIYVKLPPDYVHRQLRALQERMLGV